MEMKEIGVELLDILRKVTSAQIERATGQPRDNYTPAELLNGLLGINNALLNAIAGFTSSAEGKSDNGMSHIPAYSRHVAISLFNMARDLEVQLQKVTKEAQNARSH